MEIRLVREENAEVFRELRLNGLRECPQAFGDSVGEFSLLTMSEIARRLGKSSVEDGHFVLGAFDENSVLLGVVGIRRNLQQKLSHTLIIWGMYVLPTARRKGVGSSLLRTLINYVEEIPGAEQIKLSVESTNLAAQTLYEQFGFQCYGTEPRAIKVDETYFDEHHMIRRLEHNNRIEPRSGFAGRDSS